MKKIDVKEVYKYAGNLNNWSGRVIILKDGRKILTTPEEVKFVDDIPDGYKKEDWNNDLERTIKHELKCFKRETDLEI